MRTIELSPDVTQDEPAAWLAFDCAGDSYVFHDRGEAEDFVMEQSGAWDGGSEGVIYPLWAGHGQSIEEDET